MQWEPQDTKMKDFISKIDAIQNKPVKPKKTKLTEDSVKVSSSKPMTLRDMFEDMNNMRPLAVLDPRNQSAGTAVMTSKNPSVQNLLKGLDPKDVQVVMTQQNGQQQTTAPSSNNSIGSKQPMISPTTNPQQQVTGQPSIGSTQVHEIGDTPKGREGLGRYVKAASRSMATHSRRAATDEPEKVVSAKRADHSHKAFNRQTGIEKAADKLTKLDELSPETLGNYEKKATGQLTNRFQNAPVGQRMNTPSSNAAYEKTADKRVGGILHARDKIARQPNQSVNELSTETLSSYKNKSTTDSRDRMQRNNAQYNSNNGPTKSDRDATLKKVGSRTDGRETANRLIQRNDSQVKEANYSAKAAHAGKDIGKPGKNFSKIASSAGKKYGSKAAGERVAGAVLKNLRKESVKEGDIPPMSGVDTRGAGLGAGRSDTTLEGKKMRRNVRENTDNRINAARLQGHAHGLSGHAHIGKNYEDSSERKAYHNAYKDGLDACYSDDLDEDLAGAAGGAIAGGMVGGPLGAVAGGLLGSTLGNAKTNEMSRTPPATVHGMDDQMLDEDTSDRELGYQLQEIGYQIKELAEKAYNLVRGTAEEGRAHSYWFPHILGAVGGDNRYLGGSMSTIMDAAEAFLSPEEEHDEEEDYNGNIPGHPDYVRPSSEVDESKYDSFAFEAWDKQLNKIINEDLDESISVSINKGDEPGQNSVNVNATDEDSEQLLAFVKNAGLGLFGNEGEAVSADSDPYGEQPEVGGSSEMNSPGGIDVVNDQEGMMGLLKKLTGIGSSGTANSEVEDYFGDEDVEEVPEEDFETQGQDSNGEPCEDCGQAECECAPLDEVETEDQQEFMATEDNPPDSGAEDSEIDAQSEAEEDADVAQSDVEEDEEPVNEWANDVGQDGTDTTFDQDIDFMTKVISGGLNKPKSTGQATTPVNAAQTDRMHTQTKTNVNESIVRDFKRLLAGFK